MNVTCISVARRHNTHCKHFVERILQNQELNYETACTVEWAILS